MFQQFYITLIDQSGVQHALDFYRKKQISYFHQH
jgi:hypothetical protein